MRTTCLICEGPVIRPGNVAHQKEWLLCPRCRSEVQAKVSYAVKQVEIDRINGPRRKRVQPQPQPWYIPDPWSVVWFAVGVLLVVAGHALGGALGWWQ